MAGYTRTDTTNNIADGNIINATDLDNEFDGIQAAFNSSTGHNHDGTTGEGAPILVLGPTQDVVVGASTVTPKTTNTVDIGSSSLKFKDLFLAGNASIGGTLAVTGVATLTAQPILSSLTASRAVFTDGSKGLVSNAITGTGNVVMSASPTLTGTISAEALTTSGAVTLSGGTANGVAYLNGSKVLTTGSALTFDGTSFLDLKAGANQRFYRSDNTRYGFIYADNNGLNIGATSVAGEELRLSATGAQIFYTGSTPSEQMRLTSTGLGIGTSSPAQKLSVAGNGNFIGTGVTSLTSPTVYFSNTTASTGRTYALNSTDGGLFQIFDASAGNATRVTLDSSGNLGLGVTPSAWNSNYKAIQVKGASFFQGAANTEATISANNFIDGVGDKYIATAAATAYTQFNGQHIWKTAPSGTAGNAISFTQAMSLTAAGELLVGTTSSAKGTQGSIISEGQAFENIRLNGTGTQTFVTFNLSGTTVGSITASGSTTTYNTSSDYRLKNTVAPMTGALAKVAQLKPCTYKWNADGSDGEGFIAHELAEVVPQCVTGEKDAVDAEGNPQYQGIDTSFLVATLTAAIQELKAEFDAYKASHP